MTRRNLEAVALALVALAVTVAALLGTLWLSLLLR